VSCASGGDVLSLRGVVLQNASELRARWVFSAGGGPIGNLSSQSATQRSFLPFDVSMPWLLRDAGGRLNAGERTSDPVEVLESEKYDSAGDCWFGEKGLGLDPEGEVCGRLTRDEVVLEGMSCGGASKDPRRAVGVVWFVLCASALGIFILPMGNRCACLLSERISGLW
jgi:hypothetical protein